MLSMLNETQLHLAKILRGKNSTIELSLAAILAGGHILLEGPPGTGKTLLAKNLAFAFGSQFHRIQMTSDLLPSDIIGFLRIKPGTTEFEFRKGPIFTHFLLADELNRSNPKTQSALLEAMAESTVSVDGTTYSLPQPFFVIATQNPVESHGVYPLAESQLDRFMLQLQFDFPSAEDEFEIYKNRNSSDIYPKSGFRTEDLLKLKDEVKKIHIEDSLLKYIQHLIRATRNLPDISYGASVRGGIHFCILSQALAFLRGRDFVTPTDIQDLAIPVLAHRISFRNGQQNSGAKIEILSQLLKSIRSPK